MNTGLVLGAVGASAAFLPSSEVALSKTWSNKADRTVFYTSVGAADAIIVAAGYFASREDKDYDILFVSMVAAMIISFYYYYLFTLEVSQ